MSKCQFHQLLSMMEARHQIRQEIVSNVRDISHITSQILQIYEFAEPDQNPDQTVLVRFGFFTFTGSVRFGSSSTLFFCMSVLVRFVRFEFGSIPISTCDLLIVS